MQCSSQLHKSIFSLFYSAEAKETQQGSASHLKDLLLSSQMTPPSSFCRDLKAQVEALDYKVSK